MTKLVILDRDGVINYESPNFIKSPEEWLPIPGSLEAIAKLNQAGFLVAVASNQSGIGRKLFTTETLNRIHQKMFDHLKKLNGHIDAIFVCPHSPEDSCDCRKPKPGLFTQIAIHFNIDFAKTHIPAIGDSLRDLEASKMAGCHPILVLTGNGQKVLKDLPKEFENIAVYTDLSSAVNALLKCV